MTPANEPAGNSPYRPTNFVWQVETSAYNSSLSRLFSFTIVNGTDFGALFKSPTVLIEDAPPSSTTKGATSPTAAPSATKGATSPTAAPSATTTAPAPPPAPSSDLSAGPKGGIGVGVAPAVIHIGALLVWAWYRRRKRTRQRPLQMPGVVAKEAAAPEAPLEKMADGFPWEARRVELGGREHANIPHEIMGHESSRYG